MPAKPAVWRKAKKSALRRPIRKSMFKKKGRKFKANPGTVTFMSNSLIPVPPRYRCKFTCSIYGAIASGAATGLYQISLNAMQLPFNTTSPMPGALPAVATLNPTGLSQLFNLMMYTQYRVYGSSIKLEVFPQALGDTVEFTITPSFDITAPPSTQIAMAQPYTKTLLVGAGKGKSYISNYITQHRLVGCSKRAIEDDLSGVYQDSIFPASAIQYPAYWILNWSTPDTANLNQSVNYKCTMTYYVELFGQNVAALTEV